MRKIFLGLLLLATVPCWAGVVTFDDLPGNNLLVPDGYSGITWNGVWTYYNQPQPPYTPHSGLTRIYDFANEGQFSFAPTVFNGAWFSGLTTTSVQFNLYLSNVLVGTSGSLFTSEVPTFLSSGYNGLVDKVGVVSNAPDFFVMDDLTFEGSVSDAPEPATFALVGAALIGVAWTRRRRPRA